MFSKFNYLRKCKEMCLLLYIHQNFRVPFFLATLEIVTLTSQYPVLKQELKIFRYISILNYQSLNQ